MPGLLLVPYNESMRLGQGFNSFLQVPCIDNAVLVDQDRVVVEKSTACAGCISQVVSYSSRFVDKISDVVRSMNISAASSIKTGSIDVSGNLFCVDESKFAASDLNAMVSVKVVSQTTKLVDEVKFLPMENLNDKKFLDIYGDSYISGFIEGGELHGIVSIKVLESSDKKEIEETVRSQLNGASAATDSFLSEGSQFSSLNSALSQTETAITVNWSGGGQIKPEAERWSLESLFKAAAGFPLQVAACPRRTWAILTKYDKNRNFLEWAARWGIAVPQYQAVQSYTSDLLDMYMKHKQNLIKLQAVLANPDRYRMAPTNNALNITMADLIKERKALKREMAVIVEQIDELCLHPERGKRMEENPQLRSPEVCATRLPIEIAVYQETEKLAKLSCVFPKSYDHTGTPSDSDSSEAIVITPQTSLDSVFNASSASINNTVSNTAASMSSQTVIASALCTSDVEAHLSNTERAFMNSMDNKRRFAAYRFDIPCGAPGVSFLSAAFNDAETLACSRVPDTFPKRLEINMVYWGWEESELIVGRIEIVYDQMQPAQIIHGRRQGNALQTLALDFNRGEYVIRVRMAKGIMDLGEKGLSFIEVTTNQGRMEMVGREAGEIMDTIVPVGMTGLKGFYGRQGGVVDRLGVIWG